MEQQKSKKELQEGSLTFSEDIDILLKDMSEEIENNEIVIYEEDFDAVREGFLEIVINWISQVKIDEGSKRAVLKHLDLSEPSTGYKTSEG